MIADGRLPIFDCQLPTVDCRLLVLKSDTPFGISNLE